VGEDGREQDDDGGDVAEEQEPEDGGVDVAEEQDDFDVSQAAVLRAQDAVDVAQDDFDDAQAFTAAAEWKMEWMKEELEKRPPTPSVAMKTSGAKIPKQFLPHLKELLKEDAVNQEPADTTVISLLDKKYNPAEPPVSPLMYHHSREAAKWEKEYGRPGPQGHRRINRVSAPTPEEASAQRLAQSLDSDREYWGGSKLSRRKKKKAIRNRKNKSIRGGNKRRY